MKAYMEAQAQGLPGVYVWESPDKRCAIHLPLDVVDRILADVVRGFGAVPKRGAEVGGVLIGTAQSADRTVVRIEDFEPVQCEYKHGPSYLFSENDRDEFAAACLKWDRSDVPYAVGFYRSQTREGLSPAAEDRELFARHFPDPASVFLLIKPSATRPCIAGFFFPVNGRLPDNTPHEFTFRPRELGGGDLQIRPRRESIPAPRPAAVPLVPSAPVGDADPPPKPSPPPTEARKYRDWLWLPLSFLFLLLGVLLGYQAAHIMNPQSQSGADVVGLGLAVTPAGDNLRIQWDRNTPAIRAARRGVLAIEDGPRSPAPLELDPASLRGGSVVYRRSSPLVRFRLEVFPQNGVSMTQILEWRAQ
jgi:hypothetical protein